MMREQRRGAVAQSIGADSGKFRGTRRCVWSTWNSAPEKSHRLVEHCGHSQLGRGPATGVRGVAVHDSAELRVASENLAMERPLGRRLALPHSGRHVGIESHPDDIGAGERPEIRSSGSHPSAIARP